MNVIEIYILKQKLRRKKCIIIRLYYLTVFNGIFMYIYTFFLIFKLENPCNDYMNNNYDSRLYIIVKHKYFVGGSFTWIIYRSRYL